MKIKIQPDPLFKEEVLKYYSNHKQFYNSDSGLDLFILKDEVIPPKCKGYKIDLGIRCAAYKYVENEYRIWCPGKGKMERSFDKEIPAAFFLVPRSSISNTLLRMSNSIGIIDSNYRGNLKVAVDSFYKNSHTIKAGTRLFQIVDATLECSINFEIVDELEETDRGSDGFGSTS